MNYGTNGDAAQDKQVRLLAEDAGHFSMIRSTLADQMDVRTVN
jgi:hypothetical protein